MQFSYEVDPNFPSELLPFIPNTSVQCCRHYWGTFIMFCHFLMQLLQEAWVSLFHKKSNAINRICCYDTHKERGDISEVC